jgi:hypothetical protein
MTVMDKLSQRQNKRIAQIAAALLLLLLPSLYLSTMARSLVLGDPTEFTFIANILGIAHPPGYAFITLVGHLFQMLIPIGDPIWRMHLLAAVAAVLACLFVLGIVRTVACNLQPASCKLHLFTGILAALLVGTAVNIWQHAIHANPHIITGTFLMANLYFLTKWWAENEDETKTDDRDAFRPPKTSGQVALHFLPQRRAGCDPSSADRVWLSGLCPVYIVGYGRNAELHGGVAELRRKKAKQAFLRESTSASLSTSLR